MTIMKEFEQSNNSADEKIQVSYQLSDHVRKHLTQLEASIGEREKLLFFFFPQKGERLVEGSYSRNDIFQFFFHFFFFFLSKLKYTDDIFLLLLCLLVSSSFFFLLQKSFSLQDKSIVQLMLVKCQNLKLVQWQQHKYDSLLIVIFSLFSQYFIYYLNIFLYVLTFIEKININIFF